MTSFRSIAIALLVICGWPAPKAIAEVFRSRPVSQGTFTLGAEPEITFSGDEDFTFYLHGGYGFSKGYGFHMKVGFGQSPFNDDDIQIGGLVDIPLFQTRDGKVGLFTSLGVSNWGDVAIENQLIVSVGLGPFRLYTGLDDAIRFQDNSAGDDVELPIDWAFGIDIPLRKAINLLFELGIDLHDSSSYFSGGCRLFF